ncbi:MAG: SGNH/GDSL hydrolase family protein [Verrucomicrobia bacterium]|nr:SGNH/GDSL hydrolase family protein [Verrucomicrobiota bacterium]
MSKRAFVHSAVLLSAAMTAFAVEAPLPRILIIGDSISIGYTPPLERLLAGRAVVVHNPGNAAHSRNGAARIEEWIGTSKWDVIHFNHGLHDLKYVNDTGSNAASRAEGHRQVDLPEYAANLEKIVLRMKATGARIMFATTTPYPDGSMPVRIAADCPLYNDAARAVMKKHGVEVNDLGGFAVPHLAQWQLPINVHFKPAGSDQLAIEVARRIWQVLGRDPAELPATMPAANK